MKKIIAIVLSLCVILGCAGFATATDGEIVRDYEVSDKIKNVSITMAADPTTQAGVSWHTTEDAETAVQFVIAEDYNGTFEGAKTFRGSCEKFQEIYQHKVTLTALEPGTEYLYRVGNDVTNEWSDIGTFVTDNGDNSFKFIAISDVQAGNEENFTKASRVMQAAVETMPDANFFAHLGDYVNDCTQEEWDWYFDKFSFAHSSLTHVAAAGNHDGNITNKINHGWFDHMFNLDAAPDECIRAEGVYYAFDYGNAHIVVLNTNDMYPMTVQQTNWIRNEMNSSDAQWKIILMHRAFYSAGKNLIKPDTIIMREQLLPLFDELDIDLVMAGHDHVYMRTNQVKGDKLVEDVTYVTEEFNGVETTFAVDPEGTCHILPGTAGTKTYSINDYVFDCVFDSNIVNKCFSQDDLNSGIFATIEVEGGKLVYNAYLVNQETGEKELVDSYAIKKTTEGKATDAPTLPTDIVTTGIAQIGNFIYRFAKMFVDYLFVIIPKLIINAIA